MSDPTITRSNKGRSEKITKIAALATISAIVAVLPAFLGGLISFGNVNVLSPDCTQGSTQTSVLNSQTTNQKSSQTQDCNAVNVPSLGL